MSGGYDVEDGPKARGKGKKGKGKIPDLIILSCLEAGKPLKVRDGDDIIEAEVAHTSNIKAHRDAPIKVRYPGIKGKQPEWIPTDRIACEDVLRAASEKFERQSQATVAPDKIVAWTSEADQPFNQRPGLLPPEGNAWRGAVVGALSEGQCDPADYNSKYGFPLHLLRIFSKNPLTHSQRAFVAAGGILWYNIAPMNWAEVANGNTDKKVQKWAADVKSLAPAKVLVCVGHEPDHDVDDSNGHSTADYRGMWVHVQDVFKECGVDNALWCMDFSVGIGRRERKSLENVLDLWPGSDRVDWLFFNIFLMRRDTQGDDDYTNVCRRVCKWFEENSGRECPAGGTCDFASKPWGIGAFGPMTNAMGKGGAHTEEELATFFQQAADGISEFSRLKAYVYFDAKDQTVNDLCKPAFQTFFSHASFKDGLDSEAPYVVNDNAEPE